MNSTRPVAKPVAKPVAITLATTIAALALATAVRAESVPVVNHSFELPVFQPCGFGGPVPGWTAGTGTYGSWNAGLGNQCAPLNGFPSGVPDGIQNGFTNSGVLAQELTATLIPGTTYTLRVEVGRRSDNFPMDAYRIRLLAGESVLAVDENNVSPPSGGWATSVLAVYVPANHPAVGEPIRIELIRVGGPQANFDDVRLDHGFVDCNGNGITDPLDTESGFSDDINDNGVPDECETGRSVPGDLDGDDDVDGGDLGMLLGAWGPCGNCDACPADLDGNCVVDGADFGLLLGNWG